MSNGGTTRPKDKGPHRMAEALVLDLKVALAVLAVLGRQRTLTPSATETEGL